MADNYQKLPIAPGLNQVAINRVGDAIQILGKSLPCSVAAVVSSGIVTIKFEVNSPPFTLPQVTVPVGWSEFTRIPAYVGQVGLCVAADARMGGVSGLGKGTADLTQPGNLAALVFFPIGTTEWPTGFDPTQLVLYGKPGVTVQAADGSCSIECLNGTVSVTGTLIINGTPFLNYKPTGVQSGTSEGTGLSKT